MARILVVDDEVKLVTLLASALKYRGHEAVGVHDGQAALDRLDAEPFDVVLTDLRMEPVDGMAVISGVKERSPGTAVIVLTAYGEVETAVEALRRGAYHYLTKPVNFDAVAHVVEQSLQAVDLARENRALRHTAARQEAGIEILGTAPATAALRELIGKVAPSEATVLVRGESGSGKEVVARAIHAASARAGGPFVAVNCAAIAESLLESELFGYRKGAFTGADTDREGLFEAARGGTLFLDEIGEAGPAIQAKLLRVLEERRINRVGDPREREVDVRVVAATNRPLEQAIAEGRFREDLYYRLLVFPVDVPPLRERSADVGLLAGHFLERLGRRGATLPQPALQRLREYRWPGNVRELRNVIERAHILAGDQPVGDAHVLLDVGSPARAPGAAGDDAPADLDLDANARKLIRAAIARAGGNKASAARLLGITRRKLYSQLKLLGLEEEFRGEPED
jgi:two-component system response regulator HydG